MVLRWKQNDVSFWGGPRNTTYGMEGKQPHDATKGKKTTILSQLKQEGCGCNTARSEFTRGQAKGRQTTTKKAGALGEAEQTQHNCGSQIKHQRGNTEYSNTAFIRRLLRFAKQALVKRYRKQLSPNVSSHSLMSQKRHGNTYTGGGTRAYLGVTSTTVRWSTKTDDRKQGATTQTGEGEQPTQGNAQQNAQWSNGKRGSQTLREDSATFAETGSISDDNNSGTRADSALWFHGDRQTHSVTTRTVQQSI
jgi:hypothetical protein